MTARADNGSFSDTDPNGVFGFFTYQYSEAPPNQGPNKQREIDMLEVLRGTSSNAQFALQPWDANPHPWDPFNIPRNTPVITAVTDWFLDPVPPGGRPYAVMFLFLGDYNFQNLPPAEEAFFRKWIPGEEGFHKLIPRHTAMSCERVHINFWLMHGEPPAEAQSITVTRFEFKPQFPLPV